MIEKQIKINGNIINYKEFSPKKIKKTFLILHGWGGNSDSWVKVGKNLEKLGYRVIIPDLPGFGRTPLNKVFTLDDYVEVVEKFYLKLNLKSFILLGHSNGGAISIKLVNKNKSHIKKLILNNSAGIRNDKKRGLKRKIIGLISGIIKFILRNNSKNKFYVKIRKFFYRIIGGQDYLNSEKIPFLKETYKNMISSDLQSDMKNINIETKLIWGEKDTYTPVSDGKKIKKLIKKSKIVILDNEKHGIHIQNPKRLVKEILK